MCAAVQRRSPDLPVSVQRQHHPTAGKRPLPCLTSLPHFLFHPFVHPIIIILLQAVSTVRDQSRVVLNDGSCWTIIGVEMVEFAYNQGSTCIQTPVSPFPVVTGLEVSFFRPLARGRYPHLQTSLASPLLCRPSWTAEVTWPRWRSTERTTALILKSGLEIVKRRPCSSEWWSDLLHRHRLPPLLLLLLSLLALKHCLAKFRLTFS